MERYEAIYARQSVEKKDSLSIQAQIDLCKRASANDQAKVYRDRGYSGKNTERPDFQKLLKDIRAGKISKLYVYRLDRFSRSIADFGQLWNVLTANDVEFVSVTENFDTSTPMGRAMLHIIMVFAQLERETIAERVRDNYEARTAAGSWPGGPAPFGYQKGRLHASDGRSTPAIMPVDKLVPVVRRIFEEYSAEGASLGSVAKSLNNDGIPCAKRQFWDNVSVARILHNPVYVRADEQVRLYYKSLGANVVSNDEAFDGVHGLLLYGKREANERKYTDIRDQSITVLKSVGIISSELWLACQEKLSHNAQIKNSGKGKHTWLSGLLKCAKCGYSIKVQTEKQYRWMICSGRYNLAHCDAKITASLDELEASIAAEIEKLLLECPEDEAPTERDAFTAKLEELDRRAERLMDAYAESSDMTGSYLNKALVKIEKERREVLDAQAREKSRSRMLDKLVFSKLSFEDKKTVATQFIDRINVGENGAEVIWSI